MANMLTDWKIGPTMILFLSISTGIASISNHWYTPVSDVSYNDLLELNVSCGELHSCQVRKSWNDDLRYFNCHCGPVCQELGTCCVDSQFRTSHTVYDTSAVECRNISGNIVMESRGCRSNWDDEVVKDLCVKWGFEDPFLNAHVTSMQSGVTYRNYYCFVCNADVDTDWPIFWNVQLRSSIQNISSYSLANLSWNKDTWTYNIQGKNDPVYIDSQMPNRLKSLVRRCRQGWTINTCATNWTDATTKKKCEAYTAELLIPCKDCYDSRIQQRYRNPHCAICNFEDLSNAECTFEESQSRFQLADGVPGILFVGLFSLEERAVRCPRNTVHDTFRNRCRAFRCGRGTVLVDGNCVPREMNSKVV